MTMNAQCGCASRTRRSISMPSIPGMFLSASTQAMPPCSSSLSASSALEAVRVRKPFSLSTREKSCSTIGSSSTTRTDEGMSAASAIHAPRRGNSSSLTVELYICDPQGTLRPPSGARCDGVDVPAMLRANQAVRLGLRAASRNPELSFGKALLDALGSALSMLPWLLAAVLVAAVAWRLEPLLGVAVAAVALAKMRWAVLGGALAAAAICWTLGMAFWSGALPVLAADAELQRRPPPGHFWPLAARGFPRVAAAGALAYALLLVFGLSLGVAALSGAVTILARPTPATFALLALTGCFGIVGGILLEALARLMLVRAA